MSDVGSRHDQFSDAKNHELAACDNEIAADESNDKSNQPSPLFQLNVDCFEELFEWLSLADLRALRQSCKRLKRVVDYYIKVNYPLVFIKLPIRDYQLEYFRRTDSNSFNSVNHVTFLTSLLTASRIKDIKHILNRCESIYIESMQIEGDFYDSFLKVCERMKCLSISKIKSNIIIGDGNQWMQRKYPTLEHIILQAVSHINFVTEPLEFRKFFELNLNIQIFSTNFEFLWMNRHWMLGSKIKLDIFDVSGACNGSFNIDSIIDLLRQLYRQQFYNRLHITASWIDDHDEIDQITSLEGLEKLCLRTVYVRINLPPLPKLKQLSFYAYEHFLELNIDHLMNIEQVYFVFASMNDIARFIAGCAKLTQITVDHLENGVHFKNGIIDLSALNDERQKLANAQMISFYVHETVFLSNKWTQKIKYKLIELKRDQTGIREQPFLFGKQTPLF